MKLIARERRQKISHALRLAPVLRYNRMKMIISRRTKISTNLLKTPTHPTGGNCCRTIHVLLIAQKLGTDFSILNILIIISEGHDNFRNFFRNDIEIRIPKMNL